MADQLPYWIAFSHIKGLGCVRFKLLLERFPSLEAAWAARPAEFASAGIPERLARLIVEQRTAIDPQAVYQRIQRQGIAVLSWANPEYPALLKQIETPPPVLYYRGKLPAAETKNVAIVGTRRMTAYGGSMAREISAYLAANGVNVVSGLARGVDGAAHQAALSVGGTTTAVLGCGVDVIYPPEHRQLAAKIVGHGALISDYPPGTQPDRTNFPPRNRIISGMSSAVIVVEAGEKSGSLITARFAAEQGREVFVVPGNVNAPQSIGANRLIRDGARPLLQKEELLEFIGSDLALRPAQLSKPLQMSFEDPLEKSVIALIELEPLHIDEISRRLNLSAGKIASTLTMLEIKGFVQEVSPQTFRKNTAIF